MTVYLIRGYLFNDVYGVFSSREKAADWLENKAVQENGWTPGEAASATIDPWPVDAE